MKFVARFKSVSYTHLFSHHWSDVSPEVLLDILSGPSNVGPLQLFKGNLYTCDFVSNFLFLSPEQIDCFLLCGCFCSMGART